MNITEEREFINSGLVQKAALASTTKVISRETYTPNYCYDCNIPFFDWVCPYCEGMNVAVKQD